MLVSLWVVCWTSLTLAASSSSRSSDFLPPGGETLLPSERSSASGAQCDGDVLRPGSLPIGRVEREFWKGQLQRSSRLSEEGGISFQEMEEGSYRCDDPPEEGGLGFGSNKEGSSSRRPPETTTQEQSSASSLQSVLEVLCPRPFAERLRPNPSFHSPNVARTSSPLLTSRNPKTVTGAAPVARQQNYRPSAVLLLRRLNRFLDDHLQEPDAKDRFLSHMTRAFLIWPLKSVAPLSLCYWVGKLLRLWLRRRGGGQNSVKAALVPPPTVSAVSRVLLNWYTLSEIFFYLHQRYRCWVLSKEKARPPKIPLAEVLAMGRWNLKAIEVIREGHSTGRSTPSASAENLQKTLLAKDERIMITRSETSGASMEGLLRQIDGKDGLEPLSEHEIKAVKSREIAGWFLDSATGERLTVSELKRLRKHNLREWLAWAFFHESLEDLEKGVLTSSNKSSVKRELLDDLLQQVETWGELRLQSGYDKSIKPMRISFDNIRYASRPWVFYLATQKIVPLFAGAKLRALGFVKERAGSLRYWRRGCDEEQEELSERKREPLVFCHGIGIGVAAYMSFIEQLVRKFPGRAIYLLELPNISLRLEEEVLSASELVAGIADMLAAHHESFAEMEFVRRARIPHLRETSTLGRSFLRTRSHADEEQLRQSTAHQEKRTTLPGPGSTEKIFTHTVDN